MGIKILILVLRIYHRHLMKTYAVIVAGGQGTRMGTAIPKQFLPLGGRPVLYYTIKAFVDAVPGITVVLVLPEEQISYNNMVLQHFEEIPELIIVAGGASRYESVRNGLDIVEEEDAIVFVHDGVRPFVSAALIRNCMDQAREKGSAIPCVTVTDSMRFCGEDGHKAIDRDKLRIIQTPQTFLAGPLLKAFAQEYRESFTDEASVMEQSGGEVFLIAGDKYNIKITTPEDLCIGEAILNMTAAK